MNPKALLEYLALHCFDRLLETSMKLSIVLLMFLAAATILILAGHEPSGLR